ncbi:assimilatory sulfite reductase (NADPH) flavoprotein subunit [Ahniella affigens]|uniref:assimilatory sulfite reductase (NADPH) n=1 Tax=Ahniella affigens TaxID=2021234 RepID=A0A2P1PVW0_9GAMM|nr:assimilatory sulfite reductase (NADPH) flavoprotein subunit [Ahniella affigens]AVP98983.1 assimilatory sulfite reductase (NADPH) flavoprotein subunit [Ahniella affigens]
MSALPQLPLPANLLSQEVLTNLDRLSHGLDGSALYWLSGYFAGRAAALGQSTAPALPTQTGTESRARLTIIYASHTGNSRRIAEKLKADAEAAGLAVRALAADTYPTKELAQEKLLYLIASTHGDGEPPDSARALFEFLNGRKAPKLPQLKYAVLALGDSSYPKFCEAGRVLDRRLTELGAERIQALSELDLDFEQAAADWRKQQIDEARKHLVSAAPGLRVVVNNTQAATFDREHPFSAELLSNQRLTTGNGWRDVRHLEFSLAESGIKYEPGDALGIIASNVPARVQAWLQWFELDGGTAVTVQGKTQPLFEVLSHQRELTRLSRSLLGRIADIGQHDALKQIIANPELLSDTLKRVKPLDLLRQFPARLDAQTLVDLLRPLTPRLYSIASSREQVGDEVHLTVAVDPDGVASSFLGATEPGTSIRIFVEPNQRFRLPADSHRDVILVGPGTGVAPFRGFLQQRLALGAAGRNWLFFGAPRLREDFLYQTEWLDWRKQGKLQIDVAFSRDGAEKYYVQHAMRAKARELYQWLQRGAHLYVCGDATRMAPDVHQALIDIVAEQAGQSVEAATDVVNGWLQEGRYARDVY